MNCQICQSTDVKFYTPWITKDPLFPLCATCCPSFEKYYSMLFHVVNMVLPENKKMTIELFMECFPATQKIKCICDQVGSSWCSSVECKKRGKK